MSSTGGSGEDVDVKLQTIGPKLAPYNPTNMDAVTLALQLLQLSSRDVLYDLGCGDGRLLIEVMTNTKNGLLVTSDISGGEIIRCSSCWCGVRFQLGGYSDTERASTRRCR